MSLGHFWCHLMAPSSENESKKKFKFKIYFIEKRLFLHLTPFDNRWQCKTNFRWCKILMRTWIGDEIFGFEWLGLQSSENWPLKFQTLSIFEIRRDMGDDLAYTACPWKSWVRIPSDPKKKSNFFSFLYIINTGCSYV